MKYIKIDPMNYPLEKGESWWVIHPNSDCELRVVPGAICACLKGFLGIFKEGTVYRITNVDKDHGWITLSCKEDLCEMPFYLFARYFDADIFVAKPARIEEVSKAAAETYTRFTD